MTGKRRKGRDPVPTPPPPPVPETPESPESPESPQPTATPEPKETPRPEVSAPPSRPSPEPMVIAPRASRRQARLERKRQQRRRIGLVGGSAIVVGVLVLAGIGVFVGHAVVTSNSSPAQDQTTVLFQLQAPDRSAEASALLAHDSSNGDGLEVLVPSRLITDVCGYSTQEFGAVLALPGGDAASRQALSAVLGNITVDGSWILQPGQLSKLIDLVGGVTVDVDVDVVQHTSGGGGKVLVPAGANRKLTGVQAVEYATYSTFAHSDASNQLARLQQVIDATATALPRTATAVAALLRQLGTGGSSTLGTTRLADFLVGFAAAERATGALLPTDLPVTTVDAGGAPSYRVDTTRTEALVANSLAKSVPAGANDAHPTVELLNGVGSPGLVATACPRLAAHGLTYAGSRNAASFNNPTSTIEVSNSNVDLGYQVASALQLPRSDVRRTTIDQSIADVIVTLGGDYHP